MNFGNVQGLKLSINCFADVTLKTADVKLKMTNSQRQFFAAMNNSEFQGLGGLYSNACGRGGEGLESIKLLIYHLSNKCMK